MFADQLGVSRHRRSDKAERRQGVQPMARVPRTTLGAVIAAAALLLVVAAPQRADAGGFLGNQFGGGTFGRGVHIGGFGGGYGYGYQRHYSGGSGSDGSSYYRAP